MKTVATICALCFCFIASPGNAENFQGWKKSVDKKNALVYRPSATGADTIVKIYPPTLLENVGADVWLHNKLASSKAPFGQWTSDARVDRLSANYAYGNRSYKKSNGTIGKIEAIAYTLDRQYVRLGVAIGSSSRANKPHLKAASSMLAKALTAIEKKTAAQEERGSDLEVSPPKVKGIKTGGVDIKPGRYVGARTYRNEVKSRHEIMLYDDGQFEYLNTDRNNDGYLVYSKATGRLDLDRELRNSTYNPHSEYCVYGINEKSKTHTIYARDGNVEYRLVWTSAPDRLSPTERKKLEKLAEEEANRYKFTTNPGAGIEVDDIEAVVYTSEIKTGLSVSLEAEAYVLMTDGRVMDNMPVAPYTIDIAKSRSREPDRWGYWKAENQNFKFAWSVDQKNFVAPKGDQNIGLPIRYGTTLDGTWEMSETFNATIASNVTRWGVHLTKDGRFEPEK